MNVARLVAVSLLAVAAACSGGGDDSGDDPTTTTRPEDRSIEDILGHEPDAEAIEDRYAEFVECIQADEVPNSECPTPGDLLEQEEEEP